MRRIFCALAALALGATPVAAQNVYFKDAITNAPEATTPFSANDLVPVIQDGETKNYPVLNITPGMLPDASNATLPTARANLSAMARDASDATLPTARNNLIYTPTTCDGFAAADGAITSGAATFTSASAGFTSVAVGKKITVAGAGTNYFVQQVGINTAGAGYVPGEIVTFASGVSVRVDAVSSGAVTNAKIVTVGSSSTNPATLAQVSSTAAGTGLVINTTWLRENLVTTIAGFTNSTTVTLAASAGATVSGAIWGYGSDYTAAIEAALSTGVDLPEGVCGQDSTIDITEETVLRGRGSGSSGHPVTTLMWLGAVGGTQLKLATGTAASGITVGNFNLDGRCAASVGADFRGMADSAVLPISAAYQNAVGIDVSSYASESQGNEFGMLTAGVNHECTHGAAGVQVGITNKDAAAGQGNVNHNRFRAFRAIHKFGPGVIFGNTDSNIVDYDFEQRVAGGTGQGLELLGATAANNRARSNKFRWSEPQGASIARGSESGYTSYPPIRNQVLINNESGAPAMTRESGVTMCHELQAGSRSGCIVGVGAKTGNFTLKHSDSGGHFTNEGAGAIVTFTLPAAASGLEYCFTPVGSFGVNVTAVGTDAIAVGSQTSAAAGTLKMSGTTDANTVVCLRSTTAGVWQTDRVTGRVRLDTSTLPVYGGVDYAQSYDIASSTHKIATATLTKTSDTTLANVSGLSVPMLAGKTYVCRGWLSGSSGAAGGIKAKMNASGGLTVTSVRFNAQTVNGTTAVETTTVAALSGNIAASNAAYTDIYIEGVIVVNVAGNLDVQAAQNTSDGTATTVSQNSSFGCTRIN